MKGLIHHRHMPRNMDVVKAIIKLAKGKAIVLLVIGAFCRTSLPGFISPVTLEEK